MYLPYLVDLHTAKQSELELLTYLAHKVKKNKISQFWNND